MQTGSVVACVGSIGRYEGQKVILQGWLYNRRSSGKLQFVQLRDGSGFIQCVFKQSEVSQDVWACLQDLSQESAICVQGVVRKDQRAPFCGFELSGSDLQQVGDSQDYPIAKKDHGDAFLLDHRHLWIRSRR
ncbi:MAG: OB-fold nucleic acid binding domain-containing protein, partial [Myxococcota bacterium]